jgi:putative Holliday junction resolvase
MLRDVKRETGFKLMARIMALDVGEKTIGVAVTDETGTIALPLTTLHRQGRKQDMGAIRALVAEHAVSRLVVGLPLTMDGERGVQTDTVEAFVRTLRGYVRIPIDFEDERLTTWEAEQVLRQRGLRKDEIKQTVDSLAASLILQAFLESSKIATAPEEAL